MRTSILVTVILLLSAQSIDAQYSLMNKGQLCPFDTAVAIHIDTYRLESRKFNLCDSLIDLSNVRILNLTSQIGERDKQIELYSSMIDIKNMQIEDKNKTIHVLTQTIAPKKNDSWFERNRHILMFIGGFVSGVGITYLVVN